MDITKKVVFMERDGIINKHMYIDEVAYPPLKLIDTFPVLGIKEAIAALHDMGYLIVVLTQQPDIENHVVQKSKVSVINSFLKDKVRFDDIFLCCHNDGKCVCSFPKTGLFELASKKYKVNFKESFVVSQRTNCLEAGVKMGCTPIYANFENHNTFQFPNSFPITFSTEGMVSLISAIRAGF